MYKYFHLASLDNFWSCSSARSSPAVVVNVNFPTFSYHRDILHPYENYLSPYMGLPHFLTQNPTLFSALSNFFIHIAQRQKIATRKALLQW